MAADAAAEQPLLIPGFYRCDGCRQEVDSVTKWQTRHICPACVERMFPAGHPLRGGAKIVQSDADWHRMGEVWGWLEESRRERPPLAAGRSRIGRRVMPVDADSLYPLCECGERREESSFQKQQPGLFGNRFYPECERCSLRRSVRDAVEFSAKIHPDWDDEAWLDHLCRVYPKAFELGIMPDYWYELRHPGITRRPSAPEPGDPLARKNARKTRRRP